MTTNYEHLRTAVYKVLWPDGVLLEFGEPITIADVLRMLDEVGTFFLRSDGYIELEYEAGANEIYFNLALPLSDPANDAACGAVLELIENV